MSEGEEGSEDLWQQWCGSGEMIPRVNPEVLYSEVF